jgi:hypothetical protein
MVVAVHSMRGLRSIAGFIEALRDAGRKEFVRFGEWWARQGSNL